jgi:FtsH-binding integral membrane protein
VTRARLPALGYVYVGLTLPALIDADNLQLASAFFTGAVFAYLWFLASLRALLMRFDPDGFFASVVVLGGAAFIALQALSVLGHSPRYAAPSAACAATVIIGSSLAAWKARKIPKWFGEAGFVGGVGVLAAGIVEGAASWTLAGDGVFASALGFMVWVLLTATYLLRR